MSENSADLIIVGAGLAGLMTAWRCLDVHPEISVLVIETSDKIAGDHTWSFNRSDIIEPLQDWIKPFIAYQWDKYDVKFPMRERQFVYCLPFTDTEILVEDTYYTDGFELSENELAARVDDYINAKGWGEHELLRQEKGVLPITLAVDASYGENVTEGENKPVQLGMTGGYYHAVTGYSLPEAVKSAAIVSDMIAKHRPDYAEAILHEMIYHKRDHYREERFMRLLNRMLFRASKPENRYQVLERFYGLNEGLIARFYRNCLSKKDKLRILIGKPPIPVSKALYNFSEKAFMRRERNKQIERNP